MSAVEQLRALSEAATPGPWAWEENSNAVRPAEGPLRTDCLALTYATDAAPLGEHRNNAAFIAAAVNHVRAALAASS